MMTTRRDDCMDMAFGLVIAVEFASISFGFSQDYFRCDKVPLTGDPRGDVDRLGMFSLPTTTVLLPVMPTRVYILSLFTQISMHDRLPKCGRLIVNAASARLYLYRFCRSKDWKTPKL